MQWLNDFQLILLDFDGLLVDTEPVHYRAYVQLLERRGYRLTWSFEEFCKIAHFDSRYIKEGIYRDFPQLYQDEPSWDILYQEKKKIYLELITSQPIHLMPGVETFLNELEKRDKKSCIVTHSPKEQIQQIMDQQPLLKKIRHLVTREDYTQPKPHPDAYLKAVALFAKPQDQVIGFEDSPRGLQALIEARVKAILVNEHLLDDLKPLYQKKAFLHFTSFHKLETDSLETRIR
jgi:beta-phosphoglucomutase